jgi:hypothetical protein
MPGNHGPTQAGLITGGTTRPVDLVPGHPARGPDSARRRQGVVPRVGTGSAERAACAGPGRAGPRWLAESGHDCRLAGGYHPRHSALGIVWTAVTAAVMFALAAGKARTGRALDNPVLATEGRVTLIDGILAAAVLPRPGAERGAGLVAGGPGRRVRAGLARGPRGPEIIAGDH